MLKSLLPAHLKKDWLLEFSAFLTWSLISYIFLLNTNSTIEFALKATGLLSFYLSFVYIISSKDKCSDVRKKIIIYCQSAIILTLINFDKYSLVAILLVFIATQLPAIYPRRKAMMFMVLLTLVHLLIEIDGEFIGTLFHVMIFFMLQIFGYSTIEITIREEKAKDRLAAINQELLATRFMLKESSQRKERLRISRDLHDAIGHQLTALALNLEVSSHKVPEEFKPLLQQNLAQAKTLLNDVREVVKEMRSQEQFNLNENLKELVEQLPNCNLTIKNEIEINSLSLKQQLMFCLQEGISNALRHGNANSLSLCYQQEDKHLNITLIDNGMGNNALEYGSGLKGMQERLTEFNGTLALSSNVSGCTLAITVEDNYD